MKPSIKIATTAPSAAPPIFRPNQGQGSVQRKAPPVYAPFAAGIAQRKAAPPVYAPFAAGTAQRKAAPPVYAPFAPGAAQSKAALAVYAPVPVAKPMTSPAPTAYVPHPGTALQRMTAAAMSLASGIPVAPPGGPVIQCTKTKAWFLLQKLDRKKKFGEKGYSMPATKKDFTPTWLAQFVKDFPEYEKLMVDAWNEDLKKKFNLPGTKKVKGPPRVVPPHKILEFDVPIDQNDYTKPGMGLVLDTQYPTGKGNQLTFNEAVKQKQTTLLEATINGQLFGKFSNTTREMHGDDKANWWANYPAGMTKIDDCPHAEDNLITKLYEMRASLPGKVNGRAPVLSIKINNSPCERCAKNLLKACKELNLSLRIKATFLFLAEGDNLTDQERLQQSGAGLLVAAGVPVKRWSQTSLIKRVGSDKAGQKVRLERRPSFDLGDTRFTGAGGITASKWPLAYSKAGNFDNSAQLQGYVG